MYANLIARPIVEDTLIYVYLPEIIVSTISKLTKHMKKKMIIYLEYTKWAWTILEAFVFTIYRYFYLELNERTNDNNKKMSEYLFQTIRNEVYEKKKNIIKCESLSQAVWIWFRYCAAATCHYWQQQLATLPYGAHCGIL